MRPLIVILMSAAVSSLAFAQSDAMPARVLVDGGPAPAVTLVADGCGPGLVRGRRGTCLVRRATFAHGRIVRKGCGKPIGAIGQRTPC